MKTHKTRKIRADQVRADVHERDRIIKGTRLLVDRVPYRVVAVEVDEVTGIGMALEWDPDPEGAHNALRHEPRWLPGRMPESFLDEIVDD